jgi:hypothetical protein
MKLIAIRNFFYRDTVRAKMVNVKKGEEFSLPIEDQEGREQAFELISSLSAYPIDSEYVPEKGKYLVLASFPYQSNGEVKQATPRQVVILSSEEGVKYMTSGHCRPLDVNQWTPRKLLNPDVAPTGDAKRMFDLPEERPENWAQKGVRRR